MKTIHLVFLATVAFTMIGSSQVITTSSLESEGVYVLSSATKEFAEALDPKRDTQLDVLLPYAALIKNSTNRRIIAYSILWWCEDADGKVLLPELTPFDFSAPYAATHIPAQGTKLVSNLNALGSRYLHWDQARQETEGLLRLFRRQTRIRISLEAVLFEDGQAVGPDRRNWIPRWKAYIDAERDVFETADQNEPTAKEALDQMADAAYARKFLKEERRDKDHLLLAANKADSYEECYALIKGFYASVLLDRIAEHGVAATTARVREYIRNKTIVNVHKKEKE